jgi:hypothetical protein
VLLRQADHEQCLGRLQSVLSERAQWLQLHEADVAKVWQILQEENTLIGEVQSLLDTLIKITRNHDSVTALNQMAIKVQEAQSQLLTDARSLTTAMSQADEADRDSIESWMEQTKTLSTAVQQSRLGLHQLAQGSLNSATVDISNGDLAAQAETASQTEESSESLLQTDLQVSGRCSFWP